ncbi:hypothetical protein [Kaarinaea lacus]
MGRFLIILSFIVVLLMNFGCAKFYYGYSKTEWKGLTEEEKQAAKSEYARVLHDKDTMRHEDMIDDRKQQVIDLGVSKAGG